MACRAHGFRYTELDASALRAEHSALAPRASERGVFEPEAGVLDAHACNAAHLAIARARGADLRDGLEVHSVRQEGSTVRAALSDGTSVSAGWLAVACGAALGEVSSRVLGSRWRPAVRIERQAELYLDNEHADALVDVPLLSWTSSEGTYHVVPDVLGEGCKVFRQFAPLPERGDDPGVRAFFRAKVPSLEAVGCRSISVVSELYTADRLPLAGAHPEFARILLLGGGSGHGFKFAPALAALLGRHIRDAGTDQDRVALERFAPGRSAHRLDPETRSAPR